MTYTRVGPFVNNSGPYLSAATFNKFEDGLVAANATLAPPPSGGDDTAVLQALVDQAQFASGTLILQAGTYKANLITNAGYYQQPTIIGQGRMQTVIQAATSSKPVFQFRGVSGSLGGGGLRSLGIAAAVGGSGIGLELLGTGGINCHDIRFSGDTSPNATGGATLPLSVGVHFYNRDVGMFTEFNNVEADFLDCIQPVLYEVLNGDPSFCGTGLVGNSIINLSTSIPSQVAITIGPNALPYNAPCFVMVAAGAASQVVFQNQNTARTAVPFFGAIRTEGINQIGLTNPVWFEGTLNSLVASGPTNMGSFYLVDKVLLGGGQFADKAQFRPFQRSVPVSSANTTLVPEPVGTCLLHVDLVATNYHYAYLLYCWKSPYDNGGQIVTLGNPKTLNTAGYGAPTFAWLNGQIAVGNAAYPASGVVASVSVTPLNATIDPYRQNQS